ncbi:MAG: hypothetical protein EOM24_12545, partial [Chloroflexia bacterium]|nr:hypothetical protein [Chloroflexia bacterium]
MSLETSRASLPAAQVGPSSSGMQRLGLVLLLALLMAHFAVVQLATAVQAGDAPRNLHWGLLTFENPRFLIGDVDSYERIKGFPPDPAELGPNRYWDNRFGPFHRWWGPVVPLLFASVWGLSRSYLMLHLVMPLVGAAAVFLTYRLAQLSLGPGAALLAAAFLSSYPLFREHATMAYTEGFSAA